MNKPIKIRTDYVPKAKRSLKATTITQICPRCKKAIPVSEMDEHVRIELLDPKWREQKAKAAEKNASTNLLSGSVISENLKRISAFRTDIFEGDEATIDEKVRELKQQAKEKEEKIWDGHSATISAVQQKAISTVDIEAQLKQAIEQEAAKLGPVDPFAPKLNLTLPPPPQAPSASSAYSMPGAIPTSSSAYPSAYPVPPNAYAASSAAYGSNYYPTPGFAPPAQVGSGMGGYGRDDELEIPPAKRLRTEPTRPGFIPEDHFMAMAQPYATLNITVASGSSTDVEKYGWILPKGTGGNCVLELPGITPLTTISEIKDKITSMTKMPASRQKLTLFERKDQTTGAVYSEKVVMKDALTAAYYNLTPGDTIELGIRERGGKK